MATESKAVVIGATAANFAIAAVKLAIGLGGSSAMISEGIHSGIDGVNDLLLLFGLKASRRPRTRSTLSAMAKNFISGR